MDLTKQKQLLINLKQMIEISQKRGCWEAQEMRDIGVTYNSLCSLLKQLGNNQESVEEINETNIVNDTVKNVTI